VLRSQRHDNVRRCGLVQLEIGPPVVAPAGKIDDSCALGCTLGGLDRLHDAEPVLVKEERVFAEHVVELCNHGGFVGNNARFELIQGSLDCNHPVKAAGVRPPSRAASSWRDVSERRYGGLLCGRGHI